MSAAPGYFITGTDTGVGKTVFSLGLMKALQETGQRVLGMKPVATGADPEGNADARALREQGSAQVPYAMINPVCFVPPIAPHLAAERQGASILMPDILQAWEGLSGQADQFVVEGVGGWRVPLSPDQTLADLVKELRLPVILVVGLRLGCINHALLTAEAILRDGVPWAGWAACQTEPEVAARQEITEFLRGRLPAPLLAEIPYLSPLDPDQVKNRIRMDELG